MTSGIGKLKNALSADERLYEFAGAALQALAQEDAKALEACSREWLGFLDSASFKNTALLKKAPQALQLIAEGRYAEAKKLLPRGVQSAFISRIDQEIDRAFVKRHQRVVFDIVDPLCAILFSREGELSDAARLALRERFKKEHADVYELFATLAKERDPEIFSRQLYWLGKKLRSDGQPLAAFLVFNYLAQPPERFPTGVWRDESLRRAAAEEAAVLNGHGPRAKRLAYAMESSALDTLAGGVNSFGAILGLSTLVASRVRWLRPFAAGGVKILSDARVASVLLAASGYSLVRQAPHTYRAASRLLNGDYAGSAAQPADDMLNVLGFTTGVAGFGVGVASFTLGAKRFAELRELALAESFTARQAMRVAYQQSDAVRRAVMDPQIWVSFARQQAGLSAWSRRLLIAAGQGYDPLIAGGAAAVGVGNFTLGLHRMYQRDSASFSDVGSLFYHLALDVYPATNLHLYRAGRGDRRFNLGPALSQELEPRHYKDMELRRLTVKRINEAIPPLSPQAERDFHVQAQTVIRDMNRLLRKAEALPALFSRNPEPWVRMVAEEAVGALAEKPVSVKFSPTARLLPEPEQRLRYAEMSLEELRGTYQSGELSPVGMLKILLEHPAAQDGTLFPRFLDRGDLHRWLDRLARESESRFKRGKARPLEGVLVAVKDLFPGLDGQMQLGSKTARVTGVKPSPVVQTLLELGAIPVPTGMVAAANGGTGEHAGFGYVRHPTREGYDPAGSSNATAHVVGLKGLPIVVGIGTDTGGSLIAPAGAVGEVALVPPIGVLSMKNMVPFATFLDHVGVLAHHPQDAWTLCRTMARWVTGDPHIKFDQPGSLFHPSSVKPRIVYLERIANDASPEARKYFLDKMDEYRRNGYEVTALKEEWDFLSEVPLQIYPIDAYAAVAMAYANPFKRHFFDPPRRTLDRNLLVRLPKGKIAIEAGYFDRAQDISARYTALVREKLGSHTVLVSPATEAIETRLIQEGKAGPLLDGHDRITMAKNRIPEWGQLSLPAPSFQQGGISMSGPLGHLMQLQEVFSGTAPQVSTKPWFAPARGEQGHESEDQAN